MRLRDRPLHFISSRALKGMTFFDKKGWDWTTWDFPGFPSWYRQFHICSQNWVPAFRDCWGQGGNGEGQKPEASSRVNMFLLSSWLHWHTQSHTVVLGFWNGWLAGSVGFWTEELSILSHHFTYKYLKRNALSLFTHTQLSTRYPMGIE